MKCLDKDSVFHRLEKQTKVVKEMGAVFPVLSFPYILYILFII